MSLRVIAGTARGRHLKSVPGDRTRPITDRVKEALFNIVGADVGDSRWWDSFAGTGAVGIEALSRGAASCWFTDLHPAPLEIIRSNLSATRLAERGVVRRGDALSLLAAAADRSFHYIYVAPPQFHDIWSRALAELDSHAAWLTEDGWAIAQIHPKEYRPLELAELIQFDQRHYGSTTLVFYARRRAAGS